MGDGSGLLEWPGVGEEEPRPDGPVRAGAVDPVEPPPLTDVPPAPPPSPGVSVEPVDAGGGGSRGG